MKLLLVICIATTLSAVAVLANPVPAESIDMLRIPLAGSDKELDVLTLADQDGKLSERNKRTIGILREMFPQLSQIVERKIQSIVQAVLPELIRILGPVLLRSFTGAGAAGGTSTSSRSNFDDDDDDFSSEDSSSDSDSGSRVSISLPTFAPDEDDNDDTVATDDTASKSDTISQFDQTSDITSPVDSATNNNEADVETFGDIFSSPPSSKEDQNSV